MDSNSWRILLLVLLLSSTCFFSPLIAQTPQPYPLIVSDDFSVKTIYELHEDEVTHDIWMGTEEGLYKYDGVNFQHFFYPGYSPDLSGVKQDSTGRIWCQNFSGQIFYVEGDSLKLFFNQAKYENNFPTYTVGKFPSIYFSSNFGYLEVDFYTRKEKRYYLEKDKENYQLDINGDTLFNELIRILEIHNEQLYFHRLRAFCTPKSNNSLDSVICTPDILELMGGADFGFREDTVLIFSNTLDKNKPVIIEWLKDGTIEKKYLPSFIKNIIPSSIFQDSSFIWLGLKDGLVLLDQKYESIYGHQILLKGKTVSDIIKDKEGNYWLSTLNDGIYMLPSKDVLVWNKENCLFKNDEIKDITKDNLGNLYFLGREGKVWKLNAITGIIGYLCDFNAVGNTLFYDEFDNKLYSQYSIWSYDLNKNKKIKINRDSYKDLTFLDTYHMIFSNYNLVAITTKFNSDTLRMDSVWQNSKFQIKKIKHINSQTKEYHFNYQIKLRGKRSAHNCYDKKDERIWVGYTDGLYQYKDGKEKEIKQKGETIIVSSLVDANKKGVWVSTIGNTVLHIEDTIVREIVKIDETILDIKEWKNILFLATNRGVYKYDLEQYNIEIFNELDGLPSNNITGLEVVNDKLYISTNRGVTFIPTTYSSLNKIIPGISITKVALWEKYVPLQSNYYFSAKNNNIKIEFKGLSIRSRNSFQYKYRMLGLDSTWVYIPSNNNVVRYPSLPSGNYTFQVKTVNEDGVESISPAEIQFEIDSPYYLKWWFIFLCIIFIAALVSSFFLLRIYAIQRQNELLTGQQELKKELIQSQLTALRSQMNPHFMFNALNSIQEYTLTNQQDLAIAYLSKFANLMRLYLNHSQKKTIFLQEELDALGLYLDIEKLRFEKSFNCQLIVDNNINAELIKIPPMLIQPYVENAIKHGLFHRKKGRKLYVHFSKNENDELVCLIRDNGIGRKQSAIINQTRANKQNSFATSAIANRLSLLNQDRILKIRIFTKDLFDEKDIACGTEIKLIIP